MSQQQSSRYKILIADDSQMNREILSDILADEYDIVEVENGLQAIAYLESYSHTIALLLLDIVMPEADGFEVLAYMNKYRLIEDVPVIMISSETASSYISRAYDFGVTDYLQRPFDASVVKRRAANTIALYAKQRRLVGIVADQIEQREKSSRLMVDILSHIVEFRNGESGLHVLHINIITEMLLRCLIQKTDRYDITPQDIALISTASALHDVGKIVIPDAVLNKPGRLTPDEFAVIKTHSMAGASMLAGLAAYQNEPLLRVAYEICRWHHERYDGRGYPDGLSGDDIPISAQVVALADVYDALTSERCYKKRFSHDVAIRMITNGECGAFNPLMLECLHDVGDRIERELQVSGTPVQQSKKLNRITTEMLNYDELNANTKILAQLESERIKTKFFAGAVQDITFAYQFSPPLLTLSPHGAFCLGLEETVVDPLGSAKLSGHCDAELFSRMVEAAPQTNAEQPDFSVEGRCLICGNEKTCRAICRAIWVFEDQPQLMGIVGKLMELEEGAAVGEGALRLRDAAEQFLEEAVRTWVGEDAHSLSGQQAWMLRRYLGMVFDVVRLVDYRKRAVMDMDNEGRIRRCPGCCYDVWGKGEACGNCISARVFEKKGRVSKFEFAGEVLHHVVAMYVKIDGHPYSLEVVTRLDDETLISGFGNQKLIEAITRQNTRLYKDVLTSVYNRRYYEERLCRGETAAAVAMMDIDDFKRINDLCGHQTGDQALRLVAETVLACVRKEDATVRYGGDEFIVVFKDIPKEAFRERLEDIRARVEKLRWEPSEQVKLSVSIGGIYGPGEVEQMIPEADRLMYEAKKRKNAVELA